MKAWGGLFWLARPSRRGEDPSTLRGAFRQPARCSPSTHLVVKPGMHPHRLLLTEVGGGLPLAPRASTSRRCSGTRPLATHSRAEIAESAINDGALAPVPTLHRPD